MMMMLCTDITSLNSGPTFDTLVRSRTNPGARFQRVAIPMLADLRFTLPWGFILSRINYCHALLQCSPAVHPAKLGLVQSIADRIVLQVPRWSDSRPLLHQLHWLPVR